MATVIKAGQAGRLLTRPRTIDLSDHLREAGGIVESARKKAAETAALARRDAIGIREAARKEGHAEGYRRGHQEGKEAGYASARAEACEHFTADHAALVSTLQAVVSHLDRTREDRAIVAERHVLDFAVNLATRMTFAIGQIHREAAQANLRRAIDLVGKKTDLTIRVHPDDLESMRSFAASTWNRLEQSSSVELSADPTVAPGGCMVESARTNVDASLETQVEEMMGLLLGHPPADDVESPSAGKASLPLAGDDEGANSA